MYHSNAHTAAALAWVLATCAAGTAGRFTSLSDWSLLVCIAAIPAAVLAPLWRDAPALAHRGERRDASALRRSGRP